MKTDHTKVYDYLEKSLNLDRLGETGMPLDTIKQKFEALKACFDSEYGWAKERMGGQNAFAEWLSGLCGSVDIPFYNSDILVLARSWGGLAPDATERQQDNILDDYWNFMACNYRKLAKKHGVKLF